MTDPVAGWYPDPGGSGKLRYWNGHGWTQHVSPPDPPAQPLPEAEPPVQPVELTTSPTTSLAHVPPPMGIPVGQEQAQAVADRSGPDGQVLSGWWRRFFGYLIDAILISILAAVILSIVGAVTGGFGTLIDGQAWSDLLAKAEANPGYQPSEAEIQRLFGEGLVPFFAWLSLISLALGFVNGVILVAVTGQTVGDRVVGTRKVLAGRLVPGFGPAFLRWLIPAMLSAAQVIPVVGVIALMGWILDYLWPLWDQRRQALHDKAAKTYVERSALVGPVNR